MSCANGQKKGYVYTNSVTPYFFANYSVSRFFATVYYCKIATFCFLAFCQTEKRTLQRADYLDKIYLLGFFAEDRDVDIAAWMGFEVDEQGVYATHGGIEIVV